MHKRLKKFITSNKNRALINKISIIPWPIFLIIKVHLNKKQLKQIKIHSY